MFRQVVKYKDKNYKVHSNEDLIRLMEDLDIVTVKELLSVDRNFKRVGHNNICDILLYAENCGKQLNNIKITNIIICDHCGTETTNDTITIRGNYGNFGHLCENCATTENYKYCAGCGHYEKASGFKTVKVYDKDTLEVVETVEVCKYCLDNGNSSNHGNIYKCRMCREHYTFARKLEHGTLMYHQSPTRNDLFRLCVTCADTHTICEECGSVVPRDTVNDRGMCTECEEISKKRMKLKGYMYKPEPNFKRLDKEPKTTSDYMGLELETEIKRTSNKDTYDIAYEGTETTEDFVYAKTDGSLHHGVEFVTHPITFKAWRETYLERLENELLSKLRVDLEEQPNTAGIHIHYNRKALGRNEDTRKTVIARLCFLLSKQENYDYLTKFCKRNASNISHWAKPYYIYHENDYRVPITQTMNLMEADRYHVVNLKNSNTIEFRCFGATTDIRDIQAYMVFIHNVVDFCKKNNDQVIRDTKLEDIMTIYYKKFMTDYLRERGLL